MLGTLHPVLDVSLNLDPLRLVHKGSSLFENDRTFFEELSPQFSASYDFDHVFLSEGYLFSWWDLLSFFSIDPISVDAGHLYEILSLVTADKPFQGVVFHEALWLIAEGLELIERLLMFNYAEVVLHLQPLSGDKGI